jgi:hypothetical protein
MYYTIKGGDHIYSFVLIGFNWMIGFLNVFLNPFRMEFFYAYLFFMGVYGMWILEYVSMC